MQLNCVSIQSICRYMNEEFTTLVGPRLWLAENKAAICRALKLGQTRKVGHSWHNWISDYLRLHK